MARISDSSVQQIAMYLRRLPEVKIVKIRFAIARFLYETATRNGRLNVPMLDDLWGYIQHGMSEEEAREILDTAPVEGLPGSFKRDHLFQNDPITISDYRLLITITNLVVDGGNIFVHPDDRLVDPSHYKHDLINLQTALQDSGIPKAEDYAVLASLMDLSIE